MHGCASANVHEWAQERWVYYVLVSTRGQNRWSSREYVVPWLNLRANQPSNASQAKLCLQIDTSEKEGKDM